MATDEIRTTIELTTSVLLSFPLDIRILFFCIFPSFIKKLDKIYFATIVKTVTIATTILGTTIFLLNELPIIDNPKKRITIPIIKLVKYSILP